MGQDDVGRQRDQFRRVSANVVGFASGPARVDAHVAPDDPARLRKPLLERPDPGLKVRIVRGGVQEHADAPHFFALLRAGGSQGPRGRRAAECDQQFPPSDGDCHAPLPCEVRKGKDTTPRARCLNVWRLRKRGGPPGPRSGLISRDYFRQAASLPVGREGMLARAVFSEGDAARSITASQPPVRARKTSYLSRTRLARRLFFRPCTQKPTTLNRCLLTPHKRRKSGHFLTAASCHNPTYAPRQTASLSDYPLAIRCRS